MATELKGLSNDLIAELMAKGRVRNQYGPKLIEFANSDEAAINPRECWPEFKNKNTSTMYQGFRKAMVDASLTEVLQISQLDDEVFILHKGRVALALTPTTTDSE